MAYEIVEIPRDAPIGDEPAGTKSVFWYRDEATRRKGLFKRRRREDSGEDWAEKIAAELAALAQIPAARYDLGEYEGEPGVISWSIADGETRVLVHGNEILAAGHEDYPLAPTPREGRRVRQHSVRRVLGVCSKVERPPEMGDAPGVRDGRDVMVGYLMLDAWIGNVDRHHRNWGWIVDREQESVFIAPTFDHGSSLGHDLRDEQRATRLLGRDPQFTVATFWKRGRSRFWSDRDSVGWVRPIVAFQEAAQLRPRAAAYWLDCLRGVEISDIAAILADIPNCRMSSLTSEFCLTMLKETRSALLSTEERK